MGKKRLQTGAGGQGPGAGAERKTGLAAPTGPRSAAAYKPPAWTLGVGAAAIIVLAFWVYSPALHGPFLFDDTSLPFALPGFAQPLIVWLRNVRPVLYLTYWVNAQISGDNPYSYHVVNVLIHCVVAWLVFLIVRRLLSATGGSRADQGVRPTELAGFAAAVFLLHPV